MRISAILILTAPVASAASVDFIREVRPVFREALL